MNNKGIGNTIIIGIVVVAVIVAAVGGFLLMQEEDGNENGDENVDENGDENGDEADVLRVVHYWTSGSEEEAIENVFGIYNDQYPDVDIVSAPIAGGGGTEIKSALRSQMLAGEAPDAFQTQPGYSVLDYVDADLMEPVTNMYEQNNWEDILPEEFLNWSQVDGEYYIVPINLHRRNVIFYNMELFEEAGIEEEPSTWEDLFEACEKIEQNTDAPAVSQGLRSNWTAIQTFNQIAYSVSPEFVEDLYNGNVTSADNPDLIKTLERMKEWYSYLADGVFALTWDEASSLIAEGEAAMQLHGDWARGEYETVHEMKYGEDYGSFAVPGTADMIIPSIDSFAKPRGAQHPTHSSNFLGAILTEEVQTGFNPIKGSAPIRNDVSTTDLSEYTKEISDGLDTGDLKIYPGGRHTMMPPIIEERFSSEMGNFAEEGNVQSTAQELTNIVKNNSDAFTIEWDIS